ncbi:TonB-dependent receptor [Wenyingzhuangia sp. IMCC45533]
MIKYFFVFFLGLPLAFFGQKIKVIDAYTQQALANVRVKNINTQSLYTTDKQGEFYIKQGDRKGFFEFKIRSHVTKKIAYKQLKTVILLEPQHEGLESIVLSVARVAEKKQSIPEHIEIITKKSQEYISPQTSADLLANVPGVRVQKSQLGGGSPVIRGMESNRVLLVIDGVRLNNAIYRTGHLQNSITISPFVLERTEVVFGPASVTYGSDALGGVVHFYTKKLNYSNSLVFKNDVFTRYSSANHEKSFGYSNYASHKKWASFSSISYSSFDDLRIGKNRKHGYKNWGKVFQYSKNTEDSFFQNSSKNENPNIQKNTAYRQLDILQKLMFPVSKNINLVLNTQFSKSSDIPNFGKLNDEQGGALKFAEWRYGPQQRLLLSSQLKFKDHQFSLLQNGVVTLAYQNVLESRINRQFNSLNRVTRKEKVDIFSLNSDFYKSLSKKGNRKLFYGFELIHNNVDSKAKGEELVINGNRILGLQNTFTPDTRYPDGGSTYTSAAVYSSYRQKLNKKHTLNTGLRYTGTLLKAKWNNNVSVPIPDNQITLRNSAITGSVGYIYKPNHQNKISFVLSRGFRSPNVDDIGKIRSKSGKITVPNSRLEPEHLYSGEFGYQLSSKDKKFKLSTNGYYTLLDNYISRSPSSEFGTEITFDGDVFTDENILANNNQNQAYIYGGTLGFSWEVLKHLKTNASITYTKGATHQTNEPLSSIPPTFGNMTVGWYQKKYNFALEYRFALAKKLKDYNVLEGIDNLDETPNNQGTPAWSIFNLNTNYYVTNDFSLQLQLQNILDVHYKEFASSLSAPGRNLVFSLAYSF